MTSDVVMVLMAVNSIRMVLTLQCWRCFRNQVISVLKTMLLFQSHFMLFVGTLFLLH